MPSTQAYFFGAINANHTVYTDAAVTVGTINFNNAYTYVVTGAGSLTLHTLTGNAAGHRSTGNAGAQPSNHHRQQYGIQCRRWGKPYRRQSADDQFREEFIDTDRAGTVTYQSIITVNSNASIAFADSTHAHQLSLAAGATATLGGPVLEVDSLSNLGTINLLNNKMLINYGSGPDPIASIEQWIKNGCLEPARSSHYQQ